MLPMLLPREQGRKNARCSEKPQRAQKPLIQGRGAYSTRTRTTLGRAASFSTRSGWKVPVASSMV